MSSEDNFCKQFGPRPGPTFSGQNVGARVGADLDPNCLTFGIPEFFLQNLILKKIDRMMTKKLEKFPRGQRVKYIRLMFHRRDNSVEKTDPQETSTVDHYISSSMLPTLFQGSLQPGLADKGHYNLYENMYTHIPLQFLHFMG